jgi:UDP-N-acetylglucosamine 2-epimerase (non-hydrolysing)
LVLPVHPNPQVKTTVEAILGNTAMSESARIHLLPPQDYAPFCHWMQGAELILTDSGGVQEEAPSLGKPVLVFRDETERPEAVAMGTVRLVGADAERIMAEVTHLLQNTDAYQAMAQAVNPYGTGHAVEAIVASLLDWWTQLD